MKHIIRLSSLLLMMGLLFSFCSRKSQPSSSSTSMEQQINLTSALPPCILYKTKGDYNRLVPVILSDDKSRIVSYPDVTDIRKQGEDVYPTPLLDGFLMDNRGIGPNVAFLNLTYDEFKGLQSTPPATDLFHHILDADPLIAMYQCGSRNDEKTLVEKLNGLIKEGTFVSCKHLK